MTINEINKFKVPIFKVNPALNALLDMPMFEDKIAEANEVLQTVGLPDNGMETTRTVHHFQEEETEKILKIAKELIHLGLNNDQIIKATGLTEPEIEGLRENVSLSRIK